MSTLAGLGCGTRYTSYTSTVVLLDYWKVLNSVYLYLLLPFLPCSTFSYITVVKYWAGKKKHL